MLYWGGLVVFLLLELRFSYRAPSVSKSRRWLANLPLSIVNGAVYHACYFTVILGVLVLAGLLRLAVVYTFGIPLTAYFLFEILVNLSIQFHHSSIRVNPAFEKIWMLLLVPPSLHRIHHSVKIKEHDSNYGVLFSIWDRLLGTLTTHVDQKQMVIGIGSHRNFDKLSFWHLMLMPFNKKTR